MLRFAAATGLARPTVRRILITLQELGYAASTQRGFTLTPRVLDLGMAYISSQGLWGIARPHMERLVAEIGESSSMAQLGGSDIVYVARVAVPKIITIAVTSGRGSPHGHVAGKVLLAALPPDRFQAVLAEPSRSGVTDRRQSAPGDIESTLQEVRARGGRWPTRTNAPVA